MLWARSKSENKEYHRIKNLTLVFKIKSITPIAYDAACPFPFNNFIYLIESEPSKPLNSDASLKPGTASLPESTTHLVMRLANATALGLNGTNRIENEVAAMSLARNALSPDHLVPDVYGWCTTGSASGDDQGWILMQHMPGCDLDTVFEKLSLEEQKPILSQIAEIFAKIQRCEIPSTVEGFGGLTFDERGCMVGGEMSLVRGGPFGTYAELWQGMLREELKCADESEVIAGWRQNGVREKIEAFVEKGVPNMVGDAEKKVLCHGDFSTSIFSLLAILLFMIFHQQRTTFFSMRRRRKLQQLSTLILHT